MSWTDERIATLTKMWEGGATASQIAEELGGVSRNAVIGKAHRLGLKSRPSPVKANEDGEKAPARKKETKPPKAKEKAPLPEKPQVSAKPVAPAPAAPRAPAERQQPSAASANAAIPSQPLPGSTGEPMPKI
ncbi:MAG TPA: GcrA family cell cycle regulator, partial [Sphingomonadaceae bacterium]|nr:GcrA family cell cycle regulator [Sphingomonadaceae bacterium]